VQADHGTVEASSSKLEARITLIRIRIRIKKPGPCLYPHQSEKSVPDQYQSEKSNPDPHQSDADPQH
jgi:hypothetical protein